ncbi:hypothetical protein KLEP174_gp49 [Pseudomonas phage vB_PcuM_ KLEP17-4]|nr:hypothetical protein KLEP174_gp49 [Pseudomonas phage vB_PcuM_ KLEP17-4]
MIPLANSGATILGMFLILAVLYVLMIFVACKIADELDKAEQAAEDAREELLDMAKDRGWK